MTGLTRQERTSSDRLNLLHALEDDLDGEEYLSLRAYLIGALSAEISDDQWDSCLSNALHLVEMERQRRQHPGVALDPEDRCP